MNPEIQAKDKANLETMLEARRKYEQHWKDLRMKRKQKVIEIERRAVDEKLHRQVNVDPIAEFFKMTEGI